MRRRWLSADGVLALLHLLLVDSGTCMHGKGHKDQGGAAASRDGERQMGDLILFNRMCFLSELLFRLIYSHQIPLLFSPWSHPKEEV
ncbi:hypothetical protein GQ55_9G041600 [Panicum hallii var. hallii]|uniref:Secreted protein n=1 Tax=Panicum hallii var. hallii TaxID=1504633 RepID=A0A2T7BZQ9_9POAL|nr:hypothetical protein GQ55_9G041600 [Panicum hallii var. hallii]